MKNDLNLFILIRLLYPGSLHLIKQFFGIKLKRQDFVPDIRPKEQRSTFSRWDISNTNNQQEGWKNASPS